MVKKRSVYKCSACGAVVESLWNGNETILCCGSEMKEMITNTTDGAKEKHVPVIERQGKRVVVRVGSVAHPMTKEHYILFVELIAGNTVMRHDFKEGDTVAEAIFFIEDESVEIEAREYCNLHGFWASK